MMIGVRRREFLKHAGLGLACGVAASVGRACGGKSTPRRPNIVFLFSDDQRSDAMGCAGNTVIRTPEHDRLAADGVLFRNCFVTTSICCVSRATVLTGQ